MTAPACFLTHEDVREGGRVAGQYLDNIKKFDLAALSPDEYDTFCLVLVNAANEAAGKRWVGAWVIPSGAAG